MSLLALPLSYPLWQYRSMQTTPSTALDAVELLFKSLEWDYERKEKPVGIFSGSRLDKGNNANLVIMPDNEGQSLFLGCSLHFTPPKGSVGRFRRLFQEEGLDIHGISIEFEPKRGVRLTSRYWLPTLDLPAPEVRSLLEPYLKELLRTCTHLYPKVLKLLREQTRLTPPDDFHLPA